MSAPQDRAGVVRVMAKGMLAPHLDITNYPGVVLDAWNALAALEAAGLRVVPVEATEEMVAAGKAAATLYLNHIERRHWNAMLAASPFAPPQETTDAE